MEKKLNAFKSSRGVRQGDSMSPYLFVLCIEQLGLLIRESVAKGVWKSVLISQRGPEISHLMFVDDMVLFAEASMEQMSVIISIMNCFAQASGQIVRFSKSSLYVSPNVDVGLTADLVAASHIALTNDLGRYLRAPSIHKRCAVETHRAFGRR